MNAATLIVGLIFGGIIFFATKKSLKDLKAGKCAGCSCDCAKRVEPSKMPDKDKIIL